MFVTERNISRNESISGHEGGRIDDFATYSFFVKFLLGRQGTDLRMQATDQISVFLRDTLFIEYLGSIILGHFFACHFSCVVPKTSSLFLHLNPPP